MDRPSLTRAVLRAAALRCPRCGSGGLFHRWMAMVDTCPRCGLRFEREEGYWLGSMTFNLGITLALFFGTLVGGMILFWPDPPWLAIWVATIAITVLTPIVVHPWSRMLWVAVERHVRAMSDGEY